MVTCALLLCLGGCAADGGTGGPGGGMDAGPGGGVDGSSLPDRPSSNMDGFMECDGIDVTADNRLAPVDIIWVVDSSDSMENDATVVQMNLDGFARDIEMRGIDFRVVMITDRSFVTPSPLFGTDPRFLFVNRGVGSNDAFDRVMDQFPMYRDHLRPMAITHIIGVSDDEENTPRATFISTMETNLGHSFTYHAIVSPPGDCSNNSACISFPSACTCAPGAEGCGRPGSLLPAAAPGDEHWAAAGDTMGLTFSICTNDWSGLFDTLAMTVAVSMELPCSFELPDPPMGMAFNPSLINVQYTPDGAAQRTFPGAANEGACGGGEGWYYDDPANPTAIILCPAACTAVMAGPGAIDIKLGCVTIPI